MLFDVKTEKGPKARLKVGPESPEVGPGKDPEKKLKVAEKAHVRSVPVSPAPVMSVLPHEAAKVPIVRSLPESPLSTLLSTPSSPLSPILVGPVAMGTVEEIEMLLLSQIGWLLC